MEAKVMTIGASLLLIAAGAILRFAVSTVSTHGIGVHMIGDILMIIGIVGILLWLLIWAPFAPGRRRSPQVPPRDAVPGPDGYYSRDGYRYGPDGRRVPADWPTGEYPTQEYPEGDPRYAGRRYRP
jgi:hypothetical protein